MVGKRTLVVGLGAVCLVVSQPAAVTPAHADAQPDRQNAESTILLSADGEQWGTELSEPLFGGSDVLVAGDVVEAEFWVRNTAPTDATSTLEARWLPVDPENEGDRLLAERLVVAFDGDVLDDGDDWRDVALSPGEQRVVTVQVELPVGAQTHQAAAAAARLHIDVFMEGRLPVESPEPTSPGQPGAGDGDAGVVPGLPSTGITVILAGLVLLGGVLAGVGRLVARSAHSFHARQS